MKFTRASVVDILRCSQRDSLAIQQLEDVIQNVLKISGRNTTNNAFVILKRQTNVISSIWYYLLTSASNLQTLGEEYTGLLRISQDGKIPSRFVQLVWLLLYTGGEPATTYILNSLKQAVIRSSTLESNAKVLLLQILNFSTANQEVIRKFHYSLFYITGTYYNISNRTMRIKYVLLRHWMQDNLFSEWFKILGNISLFYVLYDFINGLWQSKTDCQTLQCMDIRPASSKMCALCCESRKNPCCTPCGHVYCWDCIYDSLAYQKWCPMCREALIPSRIILLQNYI